MNGELESRDLVTLPRGSTVAQAYTAAEMQAQVQRIQQVMRSVMKPDVHFGKIPGTDKPTLYKAGSEVLLTTFHIGVDPVVDDLSQFDEVRYRVRCRGVHHASGNQIGVGIGEASSSEEKYRWRKAVCAEEFDATPEDRRRHKWVKPYGKDPYQVDQVRTSPADVANTVLKMAKKRAQIDLTLTALAASDCFTQDLEDMPEELRDSVTEGDAEQAQPPRARPATSAPRASGNGGRGFATEKQRALVATRLGHAELPLEALLEEMEIDALDQLRFDQVDAALNWIKANAS